MSKQWHLIITFDIIYNLCNGKVDRFEKDEMSEICSTHGMRNPYKILVRKPEGVLDVGRRY
jgi:hypothetical protein